MGGEGRNEGGGRLCSMELWSAGAGDGCCSGLCLLPPGCAGFGVLNPAGHLAPKILIIRNICYTWFTKFFD